MGLLCGALRNYCLGGCSALVVCARCSRPFRGGWGRFRVLCLPRFPLPAPRFPRCVWRAVPSGCPLSSLPGTPFHAVCAFHGLGPVALLVFPACPLRVCALALSLRPRLPFLPGSVWLAHLARSRCWVPVWQFFTVRAPLRVLPRSGAPFGLLRGGAARSRSPPAWLGVVCPPWGEPASRGRSGAGGVAGGRGRPYVPCSPEAGPGGPEGRGVALPWSVPLPSLGRQQSGCNWRCSVVGGCGPHTAPVRVRVLSPGVVRWRRFASLPRPPREPAGGCVGARGVRAQLRPRPGRRGPFRGRGGVPSALARRPRAGGGEWGERGGGGAPWFPISPLRGGGLWLPAQTPLLRRRIPPRYTSSAGVVWQPQSPGAAWPAAGLSAWQGGGWSVRCPPFSPPRPTWRP